MDSNKSIVSSYKKDRRQPGHWKKLVRLSPDVFKSIITKAFVMRFLNESIFVPIDKFQIVSKLGQTHIQLAGTYKCTTPNDEKCLFCTQSLFYDVWPSISPPFRLNLVQITPTHTINAKIQYDHIEPLARHW